jgi:hypothetical protein
VDIEIPADLFDIVEDSEGRNGANDAKGNIDGLID